MQHTAQQQIDVYEAVLSLAASLSEAIKNPKAVSDAAKIVAEANTISLEKKKEVELAEQTIAQAKADKAEVEMAKSLYNDYVVKSNKEIKEKTEVAEQLKLDVESGAKSFSKVKAEHENKVKEFEKYSADAKEQYEQKKRHLFEFSNELHELKLELYKREQNISAREVALKENQDKLVAQKKKLLDAATGG